MSVHRAINNGAILAACLLSSAGALVFNAFPVFLSTIAQEFTFGDEQLGLLGSYYLGGFALVALFAPLWMPRLPWRLTAGVAYGLVSSALVWLSVAEPAAVHSGMMLLGLGSAFIFTIGLGVLSAAPDPGRAYGFKLSAEMIVAAITMFVMTKLVVVSFGYNGFIWASGVIYGLSALAIIGLPTNFLAGAGTGESQSALGGSRVPVLLASVALFIQFGTFSGLWAFMERMGSLRDLEADTVGTILTLSLLFGLCGALTCAALGDRFGQRVPILLGMGLTILAIGVLQYGPGVLLFAVAACLINALLQFLCAYQMGLVTNLDSNGRFTVMIAFILAFSGAIGPGVMGTIVENRGYEVGLWLCAATTALAVCLTVLATRRVSR